ncbi:MAG: ABC transporter ATP-binding protein [Chloroflexota bacterium]|nr:MAG: ABC transporter ATP-binding protein [Chloroflexota bacterium]
MSDVAIRVEALGKHYRIGAYGLVGATRHRFRRLIGAPFGPLGGSLREPTSDEVIWALKDVSFEIKRGQVVGVMGPNGAGKSTLLKILSRITEPTEGQAEIKGRVGSLLEVGTGFHPELTGRENVFLNGAILGMKKREIDRKFDEIVAFADVEKFLDTPVKRYSSGMYVRLAFAVAAHLETEILLLDEVLAVGDAAFQKKCIGKIGCVADEGRTIVFVSHDLGALQRLCKHAIWLDKGRIVSQGETARMVVSYLNAGVQCAEQTWLPESPVKLRNVVLRDRYGTVRTTFSPGDEITVEIQYTAACPVESPYFFIALGNSHGGIIGANMLLDGHRPPVIDGDGTIACTFKSVQLLPQMYSVWVGGRYANGVTPMLKSSEVASITITGSAGALGMAGELAEVTLPGSAPVIVPYEWRFPDGRTVPVTVPTKGKP